MHIPEDITSLGSLVALIARTLKIQGHDPAPLLSQAGINPADSCNANARIPTTRMMRLWRLSIAASGDPAFGLTVAHHFQPAVLHGLGFAWLASDTLHDALGRLVKYSHLINTLPDFRLDAGENTVDLVVTVPDLGDEFSHAATDAGLAIFLRMCQITVGNSIMPVRVTMQRPEPDDKAPYEAMFGSCIEYSADAHRLSFDATLANSPLATSQPELARLNDQTVIDYLARYERSNLAMQVRAKIIEGLPEGRPSQEEIAQTLNTSLRSLQRKLRDEDTNFKHLLNETQRELAMQYMRDSSRSIGEISYLLGFSESSNFTRAFKRWTGKSPGEFRSQDRANPSH
jgi:AraC-like DNA-binding protein